MYEDVIANRTLGLYPLSVATSLAIESANGVHPEIVVETPPIREYGELWVNMRTLFRNFVRCLPKDAIRGIPAVEVAHALLQEQEQIVQTVPCKVVFYLSNYAGMEHKYPHAVLRADSTENQRLYTALQADALQALLEMQPPHKVEGFELKLSSPARVKTAIITHYPYDLLSWRHFGELTLLESHTGAFKERAQWYTKYLNGKELPVMPFREDLIQLFGDAEHFRPGDPRLRRELCELVKKYHWSAITTYDKILYAVEQLQNPAFKLYMRQILSRTY